MQFPYHSEHFSVYYLQAKTFSLQKHKKKTQEINIE